MTQKFSGSSTADGTSDFDVVRDLNVESMSTLLGTELGEMFSENVIAKVWRVAVRELEKENPPIAYPEYVPEVGLNPNVYIMTEANFWTCGFFPGSMYVLLERLTKFPDRFPIPSGYSLKFQKQLLELCNSWSGPIRAMDTRTDTHDMSFIIQPALKMDWELTGNQKSLKSVITAAKSLSTRYDPRVRAIRSWDQAINNRYSFTDMESDFLVIIDSMCNLDLLYYAGHYTKSHELVDIATTHAHTVLRAIVRKDWSTYHLINFDAKTGNIKNQLTNQGFKDSSTWSRGQAWAVLGFAQTYHWTRDQVFLDAAVSLADYFISRLDQAEEADKYSHPYVPLWDFDAPQTQVSNGPLRDTSAGMITVNGLLLLYQALISIGQFEKANHFLSAGSVSHQWTPFLIILAWMKKVMGITHLILS
ncbi:unsaturated glucuronyl hydrolase [Phlyctema vagabunda]|uniref:Unsaturated glucuronyl hydrolase n=1 Tax=Phlyctema vagabunda TaxID=108571 RepID=A0ABR4PHG4_9HELO